jgi:hypothetical protein
VDSNLQSLRCFIDNISDVFNHAALGLLKDFWVIIQTIKLFAIK